MAGSSDQGMKWLYDEDTAKPKDEDYLLGKAVDKNFEQGTLGQINAVEYDCTPASIFASKADHQVDIQRKLQEDPLIALRKTEVDTRKRILDNPLKMREIQSYIDKVKKKKSKKKKKKHSKDESDDDLDALLMKKLNKLKEEESDDESAEEERPSRRERPQSRERQRRSRSRDRPRKRSPSRERRRSKDRQRRSRSRDRRRSRSKERKRSRSRERKRSRSKERRRSRSRDRSRKSPPKQFKKHDHHKKSKMSDEEREKKLREMMSNANWRDEQRTKNVKKYRDAEQKEEIEHFSRDHDPEFVRKHLLKAAEAGTVEQRINSNRHNIQRSGMAMDKNFARK